MTKIERLEHLKDLVTMLNGSEFGENGTLVRPNNQLIKRIQANARITYLTDTGRLSNVKNLMVSNQYPISSFEVIEHDEFNRVLHAVLNVQVNGKNCQIPIVDM